MSFHLYDINELYSNADGTVQFIELKVGASNGENQWQNQSITATQGSTVHSFTFPTNLPSSATANKPVLIATQGFADLGIVTPDFIVPAGFLFVNGGTVSFASVDSVTYTALPTDGTLSINRLGVSGVNSPTNFSLATGSIAGNSVPVPSILTADQVAGAGQAFLLALPSTAFTDANGDTLSYTATLSDGNALPSWLSFDAGTRTFSGTPSGGDVGVVSLTVAVSDGHGGTASDSFNLEVISGHVSSGTDGGENLAGTAQDDRISALAGNDTLNGGAGNDILDGGAGTDTAVYSGLSANYTITMVTDGYTVVDNIGIDGTDTLIEMEELQFSDQTLSLNHAPTLATPLSDQTVPAGNVFSISIPENSFNDIDGDVLGYTATLEDGSALPTGLSFDSSSRIFNGTDIAVGSYSIKLTASDGSLSDFATFGLDVKTAVIIDDKGKFTGGDDGEFISGSDGAGADKMIGGGGDDTYIVDNKGDRIAEKSGDLGGIDEIRTSLNNYKLGANIESLVLTDAADINGFGNGLNNTLVGNIGNNTLDGGAGEDSFEGGDGDDIYLLDKFSETVTEYAGEGNDLIKLKVNSAGSYNMADQADNVEGLILTGTGLIDVTGNDSDNTITGNAKANQLDGGAGDDELYGGLGRDTLTGGDGADTFIFNTAPTKANVDTVTDFASGIDVIALDDKIFKKLLGSTDLLQNFESIAADGKATDLDNFLLYDSTSGKLYYDADGSGRKAAVLIGVFDDGAGNHASMDGTDFMVV